jgi:hypothetical protein
LLGPRLGHIKVDDHTTASGPKALEPQRGSCLVLNSQFAVSFEPAANLARIYDRSTGRSFSDNHASGVSSHSNGALFWNKGRIAFFSKGFQSPVMWTPRSGCTVLAAGVFNEEVYICEESKLGPRVCRFPLRSSEGKWTS